jgi:hypothetical protein
MCYVCIEDPIPLLCFTVICRRGSHVSSKSPTISSSSAHSNRPSKRLFSASASACPPAASAHAFAILGRLRLAPTLPWSFPLASEINRGPPGLPCAALAVSAHPWAALLRPLDPTDCGRARLHPHRRQVWRCWRLTVATSSVLGSGTAASPHACDSKLHRPEAVAWARD